MQIERCDIFCQVIDNYGDIGFAYRLSKEFSIFFQVYLWVDDLLSFQKIENRISNIPKQKIDKIVVYDYYVEDQVGNLVIESFGCNLPEHIQIKLLHLNTHTLWINLEYLSLEKWVNDFHLKLSFENQFVKKYFYFPGFYTGGVLTNFNMHNYSIFDSLKFQKKENSFLISIFSYKNRNLEKSLLNLSKKYPIQVLVTSLSNTNFENIEYFQLPHLNQDEYDSLLLSCDLNIVRGEESFIRANLTQKPFLWDIYKQDNYIHFDKLKAFLDIYDVSDSIKEEFLKFNKGQDVDLSLFLEKNNILNSEKWSLSVKKYNSLITNLLKFIDDFRF